MSEIANLKFQYTEEEIYRTMMEFAFAKQKRIARIVINLTLKIPLLLSLISADLVIVPERRSVGESRLKLSQRGGRSRSAER